MNNSVARQNNIVEYIKASNVAKWLLARGISSITTDELADILGVSKTHVPQRMMPLRKRGEIISPANGLWIPIPPEYMTWGAPPAIDFVDTLMRHLKTDYYVGWLSASEIHGASHHAPQVFQVATSRSLRSKSVGRSRFKFYHREHIKLVSLIEIESKNGMIPISSKETTLLDIANDISIVGGVDNAANLIIEMCEYGGPDIETLAKLSELYPTTAVRRLGFLMESFTITPRLEKLSELCKRRKTSVSILDPQLPPTGELNTEWNIRINREVSPDV